MGSNKNTKIQNSIKNKPYVKILKYIRTLLFISVLILMFYPPFLRGLYFEPDQLSVSIFVFIALIIFWIYKLIKNDKIFLKTPIEYASIGFVIIYFISIFVAVGPRLAVIEWLKYCMYIAVFFMISELADSYKSRLIFLWTIVASAVIICLIGFDGATGEHFINAMNSFFKAKGIGIFFKDIFLTNRMYSVFQYPNVLGVYLAAVFFICIGLIIFYKNVVIKAFAGAISFLVFLTLILTLSRGAYLALFIALVIFLLIVPRGIKVKVSAFILASGISTIIVLGIIPGSPLKLFKYIMNNIGNEQKIWMTLIIGLIISAGLTLVANFCIKWLEKISWKTYLTGILIIIVTSVIGIICLLNITEPVTLSHNANEADSKLAIEKSIVLVSNKRYTLETSVDASTGDEKKDAFQIVVSEIKNNSSITMIKTYSGKDTKGKTTVKFDFNTSNDVNLINFSFQNNLSDTKAKFFNAQVVDSTSGKVIKNIVFKYKFIPDKIVGMFENFTTGSSAVSRNIFINDGLKIFKDHWLIGAGGGAWQLLYTSYQSYYYQSNQVHSFYVQILLECGILGLIAIILFILALLVMMFISYYKKNESEENEKFFQTVVFTSIAVILIHSTIDFDLSLSAISILLWGLIALFNSSYKVLKNESEYRNEKIQKVIVWLNKVVTFKEVRFKFIPLLAITTILFIIPILFNTASKYEVKSLEATKANDLELAKKHMKTAVQLDPLKPQSKVDYANLIRADKSLTMDSLLEAKKVIMAAENVGKYDAYMCSNFGKFYLSIGEIDKGIYYFDRSVKLVPKFSEQWEQKLKAYSSVIFYYFGKGDTKKAIEYLDKISKISDEAKKENYNNIQPIKFSDNALELLEKLRYIKDNYGLSNKVDVNKLAFYNLSNVDINLDGIPDQWTVINPIDGKIIYNNDLVLENKNGKQYQVQSRILNLKQNMDYEVQIELKNPEGIDKIPYISSWDSKQSYLTKQSGNIYSATISTPAGEGITQGYFTLNVDKKYIIKQMIIRQIL